MEKEFYVEYKKKLSELSETELKERDIYLKKLANGELYGPLTGVPSIDKVWNKNYSDDALLKTYPKKSMYDFLYDNNKNNMDKIAINYFGKKVTYKQLFENIDKYAKMLLQLGIKQGDSVAICMPTTPESIYLFYAINRIGAVSNLIDVRKSKDDIKYCINITKSKAAFIYDGIYDQVAQMEDQITPEIITPIPATFSFGKVLNFISSIKSLKKNKKYKKYVKFESLFKNISLDQEIPPFEYDDNALGFVEYTSGSTGFPKTVGLSNGSANARVFQYMNNGMEYKKGDKYLDIIPLFIAFGTVVGIHLPLSMGMEDIVIPAFNVKKAYNLMKKYKPNHLTFTPAAFIELINHRKFKKLNFSKVNTWGCGGDGMNASEEVIIDSAIEKQDGINPVNNGYGASEIGAPFCTQIGHNKKAGSVGFPLPYNNIVILDNEGNEVGYNVIGEICMVVDYPMLEYINSKELTKKATIELPDGKIGIKLGDAGYIDEEGFIFVKGRFENLIKIDEEIIWPVDLENIIMSTEKVRNCAVSINEGLNSFTAYIVLNEGENKEEISEYINFILNKVYPNIKNKFTIDVIDDLPLTPSGKIDRKILKKGKKN